MQQFKGKPTRNCDVMSSLITETPPRAVFASLVSRDEARARRNNAGTLLIYRYKWDASGIIPRLFTTRRAIVDGIQRERETMQS